MGGDGQTNSGEAGVEARVAAASANCARGDNNREDGGVATCHRHGCDTRLRSVIEVRVLLSRRRAVSSLHSEGEEDKRDWIVRRGDST